VIAADRIPAVQIIARCARGLEPVVAAEARGRLGATVARVRHREVTLQGSGPLTRWLALRTADDVFLRAGRAGGITTVRAALPVIESASASIDWRAVLARAGFDRGPFEVVASFLGRRNYNRFEIEERAGTAIARATGWRQATRTGGQRPALDAAVTVRVHIEADEASFGVRIGDTPLHRRPWKRSDQPGTLHPPAAAALALLAGLRDDRLLWDVFCGAGTIAIEALLDQPALRAVASDLRPEAMGATRQNARRAGVIERLGLVQADAAALPATSSPGTRIVGNAPWGRALEPGGRLAGGDLRALAAALAGVLGEGGRACLLVGAEAPGSLVESASPAGLAAAGILPLTVMGAHCAAVVLGPPGTPLVDPEARFGPELAAELAGPVSG
jgi:tRNA (guanine6-N2)-methyltransferase